MKQINFTVEATLLSVNRKRSVDRKIKFFIEDSIVLNVLRLYSRDFSLFSCLQLKSTHDQNSGLKNFEVTSSL